MNATKKISSKGHSPMQLSAVQIVQELLQLARHEHVLEAREQIHVPERVDRNQRQIRLTLAQVVQRVREPLAVRRQKVNILLLRNQLRLDDRLVVLDRLVVVRAVEQNQEGKAFLGKFFGVLEGDFPDERDALLLHPDVELVKVVLVAGEGFVVGVRHGHVRPEHDDGVSCWG